MELVKLPIEIVARRSGIYKMAFAALVTAVGQGPGDRYTRGSQGELQSQESAVIVTRHEHHAGLRHLLILPLPPSGQDLSMYTMTGWAGGRCAVIQI